MVHGQARQRLFSLYGIVANGRENAGKTSAAVGITLYLLLNWCYTTAVFTDPGSPSKGSSSYAALPIHQPTPEPTSIMAKSSGELRYCKKCAQHKPDRTHHCSTCRRCVLKMDHHCPWLATCVGLRNYKPFILFLLYTCAFCYFCFLVTFSWVWKEVTGFPEFEERFLPVNVILLCVISGVVGVVLSGFAGWHCWLVCHGQTTIESLERVRWASPIKNQMARQLSMRGNHDSGIAELGERLTEIHANALPGVTRPEEGEEQSSRAHDSPRQSYRDMERERERERYEDYLDEVDSEKLPNAFDHGWRANLQHLFGPNPWLRILPICNTTGDGWNWEVSARWHEARRELARERQARSREDVALREGERGWLDRTGPNVDFRGGANLLPPGHLAASDVSMRTLPLPKQESSHQDYDSSSDDDETLADRRRLLSQIGNDTAETANWNDLPEGFVDNARVSPRIGVRSRSPRPQKPYYKG